MSQGPYRNPPTPPLTEAPHPPFHEAPVKCSKCGWGAEGWNVQARPHYTEHREFSMDSQSTMQHGKVKYDYLEWECPKCYAPLGKTMCKDYQP